MAVDAKSPAALYALGIRAYERGDARRAVEYFRPLLEHPQASAIERLDALAGLARAHYQLDHATEALGCAEDLQREARRIGHADGAADALVFLGQIHLEYGRDRPAERALRAVVGAEGRAASPLYRANAWFLLGKIAFERCRAADARRALDRAARIYRRLGRPGGLADVEIVRGHLAHVAGRLGRALACARRARRLFDRVGDRYGKAGAWHLEGEALQALRQSRAAARVLRRAAAVYRELQDPTNLATMLVQHADLLVSVGQYDGAVSLLEEAIGILRALAKPHRLGPVLLALAHARQMQGRIVDGLALQREATDLLVGADADPVDIAGACRAQAETLSQLRRQPEARALLKRALERLREFPRELETANVHLDLARLLEEDGADLAALTDHLEAARAIFRHRRVWHALTQIDLTEARVLAVHGDLRGALHLAGRGLRRAEQTRDPQGAASARSLRAAMFARLGRTRAAEAEARRARRLLGRMGATWNLASLEVDLASQYHAAGERPAAWAAALRALRGIERVRAGAVSAPSVHADLVEAFRTAQRAVFAELRARGEPLALVERVEATRDVTRVVTRAAAGRDGGGAQHPPPRLVPPTRVRRTEVEARLTGALDGAARGTMTVAWYPEVEAGQRDLVLVTPLHGAWLCTLSEPAGVLSATLAEILKEPGALSGDTWRARLDVLADTLLENPFVRALPLARSGGGRVPQSIAAALRDHPGAPLDLVPHGWTGLVPWSALGIRQGGAGRERLADRHVVRLRSRLPASGPTNPAVRPPRRALVFGDDGTSLPAARAEARAVAESLRASGVEVVEYGGDRPLTVAALREEAARCDLLHLATHAEFNAASPWRSFVRLSRPEPGAPGEELSLETLLDFATAPREVVLSACSTVAVDRARLFDPLSLAHGFLYAGSAVVVGTLWRVDDAATAKIMRRVYAHRLDAEAPVAFDAAVRAAIRETLAGPLPTATNAVEEAQSIDVARGVLGGASRWVVRPVASPACWAALQVLVASEE